MYTGRGDHDRESQTRLYSSVEEPGGQGGKRGEHPASLGRNWAAGGQAERRGKLHACRIEINLSKSAHKVGRVDLICPALRLLQEAEL